MKFLINMENILIVGSQGYIGTVLCSELIKKKINIIGVDNFIYSQKKINFNSKKYSFLKCDLRNINKIVKIANTASQVVILAGLVGDPITKKYKKLSENINFRGVKKLIYALNKTNIKKLIFVSTCSNYGVKKSSKLVREEDVLSPVSLYANQKVKIENILLKNKFNFAPVILRFATAFGISPRMRFDLTVNEFVRDAIFKKHIEIYEPKTYRPYCHVKDFSEIIYKVIKIDSKIISKQVFNCGSNANNFSKLSIANLIKKQMKNIKITINYAVKDKRNYKVDFTKVQKYLNFTPKYSVNKGIKEIINYIKINKNYKIFKNYSSNNFGNYKIIKKF